MVVFFGNFSDVSKNLSILLEYFAAHIFGTIGYFVDTNELSQTIVSPRSTVLPKMAIKHTHSSV